MHTLSHLKLSDTNVGEMKFFVVRNRLPVTASLSNGEFTTKT